MRLEQKQEIITDIHERFQSSKVVLLTSCQGMKSEVINGLRRKFKSAEIDFQVVKNTLLTKAAHETGVAILSPYFKGPSAIAISYRDPVALAKILVEASKEIPQLQIKAGVLGGKLLDINGIKELSNLPSREILLAQLLSAMNGVPTGLVRALSDVPRRMLNVLQAIKDQKSAA